MRRALQVLAATCVAIALGSFVALDDAFAADARAGAEDNPFEAIAFGYLSGTDLLEYPPTWMSYAPTDSAGQRKGDSPAVKMLKRARSASKAADVSRGRIAKARMREKALEAKAEAAEAQAAKARRQADAAKKEADALRVETLAASRAAKDPAERSAADLKTAEERDVSAKMTGATLKGIPKGKKVKTFSLVKGKAAPGLSDVDRQAIKAAVRAITKREYECGCVFVDLASGKGIAYNANAPFYSASAFKAVLVLYALEHDGKRGLAEYDKSNAESAIRYSSNDAYDTFAISRMGKAYTSWLKDYGIDYDSATPYYASASAKSMARIWADMFQYLQGGTANAKWFSKLLAETNRSFIRDAVKGKGVKVRNKAGWIGDDEYSATTDCAYIDEAGHPYVMVVLSDQPYSGTAGESVSALAKALFSARDQLT